MNTANPFATYLKESVSQIDKELNSYLVDYKSEIKGKSPNLLPIFEAFIRGNKGGGRFRGTLVKIGYLLSGSTFTPEILKAAVAYELFQTAILVHDDIIDQSPLRRGMPSTYKLLGGDHHGVSQAICLGDVGFFLMYRIIAASSFDESRKSKALLYFSNAVLDTGLGQMLDIELPFMNGHKSMEDVLKVSTLKTAQYTVVGPMQLGAVLGGAGEELLNNIKIFGQNLGIAFQIHDDILGVFGLESEIGKPNTSDVEEGKLTLLYMYTIKQANSKQKKILDTLYGKTKIGKKELEAIRAVFVETGALDFAREEALKYIESAKAVLPKIAENDNNKKLLLGLNEFMIGKLK